MASKVGGTKPFHGVSSCLNSLLTRGFMATVNISPCKHNSARYFPVQREVNRVVLLRYKTDRIKHEEREKNHSLTLS